MGAGGSLEAAFTLTRPLPAGTWKIVGDGIIIDSCDVTFAVLYRTSAGDAPIATFTHHFDAGKVPSQAVKYSDSAPGVAVPGPTDMGNGQLVLRITAAGPATDTSLYAPNGDGPAAGGRLPYLELPPE